jgi:hypothetical protein
MPSSISVFEAPPYSRGMGKKGFGVVGILDVEMTAVAAGMAGDELIVEVDADAVWPGFDGDAAVGVARRDGIVAPLVSKPAPVSLAGAF